jgi:hypothetical protein
MSPSVELTQKIQTKKSRRSNPCSAGDILPERLHALYIEDVDVIIT